MGRPGPASQASMAAEHTASETSSSAMQKVSGEYCSTHSVSGRASVRVLSRRTWSRTSAMIWGTVMWKTISRQAGAMAL